MADAALGRNLPLLLHLIRALRAYHHTVIAPYGDRIQGRIDAERAAGIRALLDGGTEALLGTLGPAMCWQPPILRVAYGSGDRDLHLCGRGLTLVPSYFCWDDPISLADPELPPVLIYSLHHEPPTPTLPPAAPLCALLGRTRAVILCATATGATTGELARAAGVSAATASHHTTALRDAGLIAGHRHTASVLHTLTPLGAALLHANRAAR
ncbi:ArsR/SmtB family transcription factor [Streptomyces sp. 8N706]|uniref:ArsR/SmtB family transcription factor n=1 Tax=Streptomyces sp. 8N706 TaxID=3457416 RepID=UPI003FD50306